MSNSAYFANLTSDLFGFVFIFSVRVIHLLLIKSLIDIYDSIYVIGVLYSDYTYFVFGVSPSKNPPIINPPFKLLKVKGEV